MSVFAPVGEAVEAFVRAHRGELWIASGFISPQLDAALSKLGVRSARILVGGIAPDAVVDPAMNTGLLALARKHDARLLAHLHAKLLLSPRRGALLGSMNITRNGLENLEEVCVVLDGREELDRLSEIYEDWWSKGTPLAAARLRIDPQGVAGRERVPTGVSHTKLYASAFSDLATVSRGRKEYAADEPAVVFKGLSESPSIRQSVAEFFAAVMTVLERPRMHDHWALTLPANKQVLRLNVGGVQAMVATPGLLCLHGVVTLAERRALGKLGVTEFEAGYTNARRFFNPRAMWICVPLKKLTAAQPILLRASRRYLAGSKHRTSFAKCHSVEAVEYLESQTGRRLTQPDYRS